MNYHKKETTTNEALSALSKVTPNQGVRKRRDKIIFIVMVIGCGLIILISLIPKHAKQLLQTETEEKKLDSTLSQNLAALAQMREEKKSITLGYKGAKDANHPPILKVVPKKETQKISPEILTRMNAPTSFSQSRVATNRASINSEFKGRQATLTANNANAEFVNAEDEIVSVSAKHILNPKFTIPSDEIIEAKLDVAINSELPGLIRAVVSQDIYSLTGSNLLIPKGSSLRGQFNSSVVDGQSRILVVWNRIRRPDGVIVALNSPGIDKIGRAGLGADFIDRHFLERFGKSALLSYLSGFTATSGVGSQDEYNSAAQYRGAIASSFQQSSSQALGQDLMIKPTLAINQGKVINVFVAKDLDFSSVGAFKELPQVNHKSSIMSRLWK